MKCIHNCHIIHRDIKPDNILINEQNILKITDFGIAAFQRQNENKNNIKNSALYFNNTRVGRPDYVSPEILRGDHYNNKTDIYSLGLTIFKLMTYDLPFTTEVDAFQNVNRRSTGVAINEDYYSEDLINLVMRMISEDPEKRPSANEAYEELEEIIKDKTENQSEIKNKKRRFTQNNQSNEVMNNNFQEIFGQTSNNTSLSGIIHILSFIQDINQFFSTNSIREQIKNLNYNETIIIKDLVDLLDNMNKVKQNLIDNKSFEMKILPNKRNDIAKKIEIFQGIDEISPLKILVEIFNGTLKDLKSFNLNNNLFAKFDDYNTFPKDKYNELYNTINDFTNNYKNIFTNLFYFIMLKNYECPNCNAQIKTTYKIKNYLTCPLNRRKAKIGTLLKKCMEKKSKKKNQINCPSCNQLNDELDTSRKLFNTPKILIFNFISDDGNGLAVLDEIIDLSMHTLTNVGPKMYNLFAFITINKKNKNYVTFIKMQLENKWIFINDGKMCDISDEEIAKINSPTLAFYIGSS